MIVPFDDLELVYQSLRTLEPPHTHKFPRVNAQDCKLGPIQPWDVLRVLGWLSTFIMFFAALAMVVTSVGLI